MDARRTALITGITGQDGSYLAEFLLKKGYDVHGVVRRTSGDEHPRLSHLEGQIQLWPGDLLDQTSLTDTLFRTRPDEIYHLASQSFVGTSWQQPILTCDVTGLGTVRLLEAMRLACPGGVSVVVVFWRAPGAGCLYEAGVAAVAAPGGPETSMAVAQVVRIWRCMTRTVGRRSCQDTR